MFILQSTPKNTPFIHTLSMVGHTKRQNPRYVKRIRQLMHEQEHRILSLTRQSCKEHPFHSHRMIPITFQKHVSSLLGLRLKIKTCTSIFIFPIPSHNYRSLIPHNLTPKISLINYYKIIFSSSLCQSPKPFSKS